MDGTQGPRVSSPTPPETKEKLVFRLSQGSKKSSSWLGNLGASVLEKLSPEIVESIQASLDNSVPTPGRQLSLTAVSSIPTPPPPPPQSGSAGFSSDEITRLRALASGSMEQVIPSHFISPPFVQGEKKMNPVEETRFSSLRKDTKNQASLESTLRWISQFSRDYPHVSESSIISNLHSVLPLDTLKNLELLRMQGNSLRQIFLFLQTHFGSLKTPAEVFRSLNILTSTVGEDTPIQVLEKISQLLLQVSEDGDQCAKGVLRDSLRYLKLILRPETFLMLEMALKTGSFTDLFRLVQSDFSEILVERYKELRSEQRKVRKIQVEKDETYTVPASPDPTPPLVHSSAPIDGGQEDVVRLVRRLLGGQVARKCYNCDEEGHFARECPNPKSQQAPNRAPPPPFSNPQSQPKFSGGSAPYNQLPCSFHAGAKHNNQDCFKQRQVGCVMHSGAHAQADCKRVESRAQPIKNPSSGNQRGWQQARPSQPWQGNAQAPQPSQPWQGNAQAQHPSLAWQGNAQAPTHPQPWQNNPQVPHLMYPQPSHPLQQQWSNQQWSPAQPQPQPPAPRVPQPLGLPAPQPPQVHQLTQQVQTHPGNAPEGLQADLWTVLSNWGLTSN